MTSLPWISHPKKPHKAMKHFLSSLLSIGFLSSALLADEPKQEDYYTITHLKAPEGAVIEGGGIELLPDGRVAVCTRRGEIWMLENPGAADGKAAKWSLFTNQLHEPLSIAYRDGWLYAVQRAELTRMKDTDGDGRANVYETVTDGWGSSINYHEYNFGTRFDDEGNLYTVLCLTGSSGKATNPFRGWSMRIDKDGTLHPWTSGIRSPGGIGFNKTKDVFYTDNQGLWNGSSSLKWLKEGSFQGNPNGNVWYELANKMTDGKFGPEPVFPPTGNDGVLLTEAMKNIEQLVPPAVVFPHKRIGNSPTGIETDHSTGKFGPFAGQVFVGEQTHSKIHRVFLEKVGEFYQGAVFPFMDGFRTGNIAVRISENGQLYTNGSNRGWGARGGKLFAMERVDWTGKTPFEIHEMRAKPDGFTLTFTKPVDPASVSEDTFSMEAFTYLYQKSYGSPEVEAVTPKVTVASIADDGKSLRLSVEPMTLGHVHALKVDGLTAKETKETLLNPEAYYTLNTIASE